MHANSFSLRRLVAVTPQQTSGLVALAGSGLAAAVWYVTRGTAGPWPLLLALPAQLPALWLLRRETDRRIPPPVAGAVLLFLVSAVVAAAGAYDAALAWPKLWLVIGGLLLFTAAVQQPAANRDLLLAGSALFGVTIALYFLLSHDAGRFPAKIGPISRVWAGLANLQPALNVHLLHPNVAGGLLILFLPFTAAQLLRARSRLARAAAAPGLLLLLGALLLTASRGAWIGAAVGLAGWGLLALGRKRMPARLLLLPPLLVLALPLLLLWLWPQTLATVLDRAALAHQGVLLAGDFPFLGGGLGAFPGLYSRYIAITPYELVVHAHNTFIDVAAEQGLIALAALLLIYVFRLPRTSRCRRHGRLRRSRPRPPPGEPARRAGPRPVRRHSLRQPGAAASLLAARPDHCLAAQRRRRSRAGSGSGCPGRWRSWRWGS